MNPARGAMQVRCLGVVLLVLGLAALPVPSAGGVARPTPVASQIALSNSSTPWAARWMMGGAPVKAATVDHVDDQMLSLRSLRVVRIAGGSAYSYQADPIHDVNLTPRCSWWNLPCVVWDAYRGWTNEDFTIGALVWASLHGGHCKSPSDIVWVCTDMSGGYGGGGGVAIGSAYLTGDPSISQGEFRHERKHADQWAILGLLTTPSYGIAYYGSEAIGGDQCANGFEWWAGFEDGYYDC